MKFLFPEILYALAALAIPVIVHLFNFRKFRKVVFPNVAFLKEIKQETQSKSKIKHLLILLSRMLAMTCIILAFAQPYIPLEGEDQKGGERIVSIFLDNSFSMQGENEEGPLLEVARNKALEIVEFYSPTDRFQLLTQDFEGRHQRLVNKDEMIELLSEPGISAKSRKLSEVLTRQREALMQGEGERIAYLVSDFQQSVTDLKECRSDSSLEVVLVPTQSSFRRNVYIDSLWFSTPVRQLNQPEELFYRGMSNSEEELEDLPVTLSIDGVQKALGTVSISPENPADSSLYFTNLESGWKSGQVEVADYPISFDDKFFFSYEVADAIHVQELKGERVIRDYIENVFNGDPFFRFNTARSGSFGYELLGTKDLIVLNQLEELSGGLNTELEKYIQNGGTVLVIPAAGADIQTYNDLLARLCPDRLESRKEQAGRASGLNSSHYLFQGVFERLPENIDLPTVNAWYPLSRGSRSTGVELLSLRSGDPLLMEYEKGNGRLFLYTASLAAEDGNLPQHAVFVTSVLRVAEFSRPAQPAYYTIGSDESIELRNITPPGDQVFRMKRAGDDTEFIPEHRQVGGSTRIFVQNAISEAGHYSLSLGEDTLALLAFNYPRQESDLSHYSPGDLEGLLSANALNYRVLDQSLETIGKAVGELAEGRTFWHTLIVLALIFLALEILLIKFWK